MSHPVSLRHRGRLLEGTVETQGSAAVLERDGRRLDAHVRREGAWIEIRRDGGAVRCAVGVAAHGVWVALEGRTYFLETPRGDEALLDEADPDEVRAPMTGRIVSVPVRPGAAVREGDLLVTVEAMKMEFRLIAPRDGTVAEVVCGEGDRVELGQPVVRLAPEGGPTP